MQPEHITRLLQAWSEGDQAALDELAPITYGEPQRLADHYMAGQRPVCSARNA